MKKVSLILFLAVASLTLQSCGGSKKESDDSVENAEATNDKKEDQGTVATKDDDSEFLVKAASGGMLEVELGRLAQEKGQSADVKAFGAMMVTDHSKADEELKALAATKNVTLPTIPGEEEQAHINDLAKLSGAEFDKKYVSLMVDDHEKDVKEFKEAADEAKDADVKAFAIKTLPTLQQHLDKVTAMNKAM